jgi:hypothetical protein
MNKIKENLSIFFGVVFIMSMFLAAGAVEENNFMIGAVLALTGITTGILTLILQNK